MNRMLAYSSISAKISAMRRYLLDEKDYDKLVRMESVGDVVDYIRLIPGYSKIIEKNDEEILHREQLEGILRMSIFDDYEKLYKFSDVHQRNFMRLYFIRYEVAFLKSVLNRIIDNRSFEDVVEQSRELFEKHSKLDLNSILEVNSLDDFIEYIKHTDYARALSHIAGIDNPSVFDYEAALDVYGFHQMWLKKDGLMYDIDKHELTNSMGAKYDMLNIMWIYRAKKYYNMTNNTIYSMLIPIRHHLSTEEITALVESNDMNSFNEIISRNYYFKRYHIVDLEDMEANYYRILNSILSHGRKNAPNSVATLYSYLHQKDHEVARIIVALECVRYSLSPELAMKHVERA